MSEHDNAADLFEKVKSGDLSPNQARAKLVVSAYLLIPRTDLPEASVIVRDGVPHISVEGAEAGTWKASGNHQQARRWGLEYLVAAQAMEAWQASPVAAAHKRMQRRNELARELAGEGFSRTTYDTVSCVAKNAIDRIIELEGK